MNQLRYWNGTAEEFWQLISGTTGTHEACSTNAILQEVLLLAQERAEQLHRARRMAAAGFRPRMTTFQTQMGVTQGEFDATQAAYAEQCRRWLAESRYIPRKERERDSS